MTAYGSFPWTFRPSPPMDGRHSQAAELCGGVKFVEYTLSQLACQRITQRGILNVGWYSYVGAHSRAPWPPVPAQFSPAQTGAHGCAPLRGGAKQTNRVQYQHTPRIPATLAGQSRLSGCFQSSRSLLGRVRGGGVPFVLSGMTYTTTACSLRVKWALETPSLGGCGTIVFCGPGGRQSGILLSWESGDALTLTLSRRERESLEGPGQ